jgi:hypothetical protein
MHHIRKLYGKVQQEANEFTPWQILAMAIAVVVFLVFVGLWLHITSIRDANHLHWMQENPAEVHQWLRENEGR